MKNRLTIGELSRQSGVGIEAIRFYERKGLIDKPECSKAGHRIYTHSEVKRLEFIQSSKRLGFSLGEILDLLRLKVDPKTTCADVRARATAKIMDVDQKIGELVNMKTALEKLANSCSGLGPATDCSILEALDEGVEEKK
jgi:MerR family mercuric resistance operon transcriptional regulator